jgi:hypothetical protein
MLLAAVPAFAELRENTFTYIGNTNGAASTLMTDLEGTGGAVRGYLLRISLVASPIVGASNLVTITDSGGYTVLVATHVTNLVQTVWTTNNPQPFIGFVANGTGATTNGLASKTVTNTIKILYRRDN